MIEAVNLTKRYGKKTAVDNISFTVEPGTVTGFLGPNGAGEAPPQAFLGGFKAWTWQVFARITGASLKATYRPQTDPDDALTERIVRLYDQRIL